MQPKFGLARENAAVSCIAGKNGLKNGLYKLAKALTGLPEAFACAFPISAGCENIGGGGSGGGNHTGIGVP